MCRFGKKRWMAILISSLIAAGLPADGQAKSRQPQDTESIKPAVAKQTASHAGHKVSREQRIQKLLTDLKRSRQTPPVVQSLGEDAILGAPVATKEQCVRYLLSVNPLPSLMVPPDKLVDYYYEEGMREGVRPDVAFAQALKETGYFRYGGTVTPDQNNYCGLGTTSTQVKGAYFPSSQLGVRAHIQHLLAYASTRRPAVEVVDPRYDLVRSVYASSTIGTWSGLNGRWAVPGDSYGESILQIYEGILRK